MVNNKLIINNGYTLIETLMVIFLFALIGTMSSSLFFSILKTTSKAEMQKEVKQNGDYALGYMERAIRNAREIKPCQSNSPTLSLVNLNGTTTTFLCLYENGVAKISSQINLTTSPLTSKNVTLGTNCTSSTLIFSCNDQTPQSVSVSFTLSQINPSAKPEDTAQISFQTTIGLRNYNR